MSDPDRESGDGSPENLREAYEAGFAAGLDAERRRVFSVHQASLEGHEGLTEKTILDGCTTEGEAAMAIIAAEHDVIAKKGQSDAESQAARLRTKW